MTDKKTSIIQTSLALFARNGIHAVGINEVIKESKVAKRTLYHHFASKEALIIDVLKYRDKVFIDWLSEQMQTAATARLALFELFNALDLWFNNRVPELGDFYGCFFINTAAEFKQAQHPINICCQQHKQQVRELIASFVTQIQPNKTQADFLTNTLCLLKEGAITTALVQHDLNAALQAGDVCKSLLGEDEK